MASRLRSWEITAFFTAFVATTYAFGVYLFATLTPDMRTDLPFEQAFVGLATGLTQAGLMVFALLSGIFAARLGPMRVILVAMVVSTISLLLFALVHQTIAILGLLVILGACAASVWVPIVAVVRLTIPVRHQGKALGLMSSGTSYGLLLNGLIVSPLLAQGDWRLVWLVVGAIAGAIFLLALFRLRGLARPVVTATSAAPEKAPYRKMLEPVPACVTGILFFSGFCFVPFQTYLTSFLREKLLWSAGEAASSWSAIGLGGMVGGIVMGALADRISVKWTLVIAYLVLFMATVSPLLPVPHWLIYGSCVAFGATYYAVFGLVAAFIAKSFETMTGTMLSGVTFVAVGLGSMLGNYAGGAVLQWLGSYSLLYGTLSALVLALVVLSLALPRDARSHAPEAAGASSTERQSAS